MPINRTTPRHEYKRKSRESTISAEDNEELARQALESAAAAAVAASHNLAASQSSARHQTDDDETDMYDSQASQAAREMLRHDARQSFEVRESRQRSSPPADSARTTLSFQPDTNGDKRKFSGLHQAAEVTPSSSAASAAGPDGSPTKKKKLGGATEDERSVGLGIQYRKRY
jgi:acetyl-CoA acyltransferase 1